MHATRYELLDLVTPPAEEPVNVEAAKSWTRVDSDDEDMLLRALVRQGRELVEELSCRQLCTAVWRAVYDPAELVGPCGRRGALEIILPRPPLAQVQSVIVSRTSGGLLAGASAPVALDESEYEVGRAGHFGRLVLAPATPIDLRRPITVEFSCGAPAANVPERAKDAILAYVASRYASRESADLPRGFFDLVETFSVVL